MNNYQQVIHITRYARWSDDKNRRETWEETVDRYIDFMCHEQCKGKLTAAEVMELRDAIVNLEVMPSMRCMMTAGEALRRDNAAGFNCTGLIIDSIESFDEMMYLLMCGCGVGFSVERQFITKLPEVPAKLKPSDKVIKVRDSRKGWAEALRAYITALYAGTIPQVDTSAVRPVGARLKTFGGRASGPEPLIDLFNFLTRKFKGAVGRKLTSIDCHDICCMIAEVVIAGGVRRCLPAGTQVFTPEGPKAIEDIREGDTIVTGGKKAKVTASGFSGKKNTITIKHRFGELKCTPMHRVAVFNSIMKYEFKYAKDVVVGDRLVWDTVGYDGKETKLPPPVAGKLHHNAKAITVPDYVTPDIAWLIGIIHGDGVAEGEGLEINTHVKHRDVLERASDILSRDFGVTSTVASDGRAGPCIRLRAHSVELSKWLLRYIKAPNDPINIPNFIKQSTRDVRFAYLSGLLDSDGRTRKDNVIDAVATVYESLATQVVTLAAGLGIAATANFRSRESARRAGRKVQDCYTVTIMGYTNRLNYYNGCVNTSSKLADYLMRGKHHVDFGFPVRWAGTQGGGYSAKGNMTINHMRYDMPLVPTAVTAIEEDSEGVDTYDISVDGLERFTANGLVVHNSATISLSNLSDDRMRDAKAGQWWETAPWRAMANNSAAYTEKPGMRVWFKEWQALYDSMSGERGVFNRDAAKRHVIKRGRRDPNYDFVINPCVTSDTNILVDKGLSQGYGQTHKPVSELIGKPFTAVVHNQRYTCRDGFFYTGTKDVFKLTVTHGTDMIHLRATADHKISVYRDKTGVEDVELSKLRKGDLVVLTAPCAVRTNPSRPYETSLEYIKWHPDKHTAKVDSIVADGKEDVYDCTIDGIHHYVANGIVVHNCGEIILRPSQMCNLSEVVVRENDTVEDLERKVRLATLLGTMQATLTDFQYLRDEWKKNVEEEALLGVSLSGVMDHPLMSGKLGRKVLNNTLAGLRDHAIAWNKKYAKVLGINEATAVTTVKPSGTVSQLSNCASGLHPRWSPYYIRTIRGSIYDPVSKLMMDAGVPYEASYLKPKTEVVFSFPQKSPDGAVSVDTMSAIEQLELWRSYKEHWCEHQPSITVYVREHEWMEVGAWVYKYFDIAGGLSFLPATDHIYQQAPYQTITAEEYEEAMKHMPKSIDWSALSRYEKDDAAVTATRELACSGDSCEIVDIPGTNNGKE